MSENDSALARDLATVLAMAEDYGKIHAIENGYCSFSGLPEDQCPAPEEIAAAQRLAESVKWLHAERGGLRDAIRNAQEAGSIEVLTILVDNLDDYLAEKRPQPGDCDHSQHPDPCGHLTDYPGSVKR